MNELIYLSLIVINILAIFIIHGKKLTPNIYVGQTYLYVLLALLIMSFFTSTFSQNNMQFGTVQFFLSFILSLVALFCLFFISTGNPIIQHSVWLLFILCMSVIIYPLYQSLSSVDLFRNIMTIVVMMIILTFIAFSDKQKMFLSWGGYLFVGLSTLIVFEILDMIFFHQTTNTRSKLYSIVGLAVFMGFVLYDTQRIQVNAVDVIKNCTSNVSCANYPVESLGLFLDVINLFENISQLNRK